MENLIFSLNATVPIFFTMILGFVFRKVGLMDEEFTNKANKFVFQAALPALLFSDLSQANFRDVWNGTFVAYCALTTMICIVISILISCLWKDKSIQGEFVQGAYRSSAAILGSRIPTEYPCCTIIRARDAVTIDLPTPPLPLTTPITFFTCEYGFAGAFRSFFALLHEPACAQEEHDSGEHPLFCSSAITPNLLIFRIYKSYSSTTAITSISQRRFFGSVFTATQLLAGFDVKYFA